MTEVRRPVPAHPVVARGGGGDIAELPAVPPAPAAGGRDRRRLTGVDAARGLALIGMMAVHVFPGRDPNGAITVSHQIASGRSAATFAVLAGVGLALATGRERPPRGAAYRAASASIAVRALFIAVIGLLLGLVPSPIAIILVYYGAFFLLALPLLRVRPLVAASTGLAVAVVVPVLSQAFRPDLPEPIRANPTLFQVLTDPVGLLSTVFVTGYYPALAWTAYLAVGLAVGRLPLRSPRVAAGLLGGGVALAVGAVVVSGLLLQAGGRDAIGAAEGVSGAELDRLLVEGQYGTTPTDTWWWLAVRAPHTATPLDLLHTIGTAVALLGAMLLLARVALALLVPLAAAGSMTLTLYTAHVIAVGSGLLPEDPLVSWGGQVVAVVVIATLWRRAVGRGPLEAMIASVSTPVRDRVALPARPYSDANRAPERGR